MEYHDEVYGSATIAEPVLLALLQTTAVQRLKGVLQHGISGLIGITAPISRFEHSVGAMLLVRRLGAPLEEQIAALLHDVSHTAFSHVIDYVFDGHDSQSYHDEVKERYVAATELPAILAANGYDWRSFLNEAAFPLLEQPAPALCADRLDYFLRDALALALATPAAVADLLDHLVVADLAGAPRIAVDDIDAARWLGYTFIAADDASWANFREVGVYELAARAIRRGLLVGALTELDLWGTDSLAWARLNASDDAELQATLRLVSPATRFVWDEVAPTFRVSTKIRTIDPDVVTAAGVSPLSALDPAFSRHRDQYIARKSGQWPVRVIGDPGSGTGERRSGRA